MMLSSAARSDVINLGERAKPLIAGLERLAAGAPDAGRLVKGSFGEQEYRYFDAGKLRAVYREISPDELINQGFEDRLVTRGGIFVVDIFSTQDRLT